MRVKAILFDIDGTLVDSNDFHVLAWEEAFAGVGAHFDRQLIHDQIGKGTDMLVPTLLPHADEAEQERLGEAHGVIFKRTYLDRVRPFDDARALLVRSHAAGQRVVLASSASKEELDHYVSLLDARDLVAETTTSDDVENTKPAPDIFATALKKIGPLAAGRGNRDRRHAVRYGGGGQMRHSRDRRALGQVPRRSAAQSRRNYAV